MSKAELIGGDCSARGQAEDVDSEEADEEEGE